VTPPPPIRRRLDDPSSPIAQTSPATLPRSHLTAVPEVFAVNQVEQLEEAYRQLEEAYLLIAREIDAIADCAAKAGLPTDKIVEALRDCLRAHILREFRSAPDSELATQLKSLREKTDQMLVPARDLRNTLGRLPPLQPLEIARRRENSDGSHVEWVDHINLLDFEPMLQRLLAELPVIAEAAQAYELQCRQLDRSGPTRATVAFDAMVEKLIMAYREATGHSGAARTGQLMDLVNDVLNIAQEIAKRTTARRISEPPSVGLRVYKIASALGT